MVIITAVTAMLVLIAGSYAYQVLERQQGATEFDTIQKSFVTFDDGLKDVAWNRGGTRSTRFTVNYGKLQFLPSIPLSVAVQGYPVSLNTSTGRVRYLISANYLTYGFGYKEHILGDDKTIVSASTENAGRAWIIQDSSVNIFLDYRVRVLQEGQPTLVNSSLVNYVDILLIRTNLASATLKGDLDLTARNTGITTNSSGPFAIVGGGCTISVTLGNLTNQITLALTGDKVVFNVIVSDVSIGT